MKIHLDTDLGSDTDDACALAMLLGLPGVELVGITTAIDPGGIRAGFVRRVLELADRTDILVAAGAEVSSTTGVTPGGIPTDARYWPDAVEPRPSPPGDATALLDASIEQGATIVAIGPYTNLAALGSRLGRVPVVLMGGMVVPTDAGLPDWGPDMDWNVQCDTRAAQAVFEHAPNLTLTTLPPTFKSHLRVEHLPRLRAAGPIGALLAQQAESHCADNDIAELARLYAALPEDLLNFQYDAVACAVAAGWSGATVESMRLSAVLDDDVLRFQPDDHGRATRVVTDIDADAFTDHWFAAVERVTRSSG